MLAKEYYCIDCDEEFDFAEVVEHIGSPETCPNCDEELQRDSVQSNIFENYLAS